MSTYISPTGNPEIWPEKPKGYLTQDEWAELHPPAAQTPEETRAARIAELTAGLKRLDDDCIRPLCTINASGKSDDTSAEYTLLAHIEELKEVLRVELRALKAELEPPATCMVNSSGTYHESTCSYVGDSAAEMTLTAIGAAYPNAKPCARCGPPALTTEGGAVE